MGRVSARDKYGMPRYMSLWSMVTVNSFEGVTTR